MQIGTYAELLATSPSLLANLTHNIDENKCDKYSTEFETQKSKADSTYSENEEETESSAMLTDLEMKKEGNVSWRVYVAYWRAGLGFAFSFFLILFIYLAQQATSIFSNWWLVSWTVDESHRYRITSSCNVAIGQMNNSMRMMTNDQWKDHRNNRFYIYFGLLNISLLFQIS